MRSLEKIMNKLYNLNIDKNVPKDAIYIGRKNKYYKQEQSKYNNPFIIGKDGNRDEVCDKYEKYADSKFSDEEIKSDLSNHGLICWCHPERCHGEYLSRRANK